MRPEGLPYAQAADKLAFLLRGALALGRSGVDLKDDSGEVALPPSPPDIAPDIAPDAAPDALPASE